MTDSLDRFMIHSFFRAIYVLNPRSKVDRQVYQKNGIGSLRIGLLPHYRAHPMADPQAEFSRVYGNKTYSYSVDLQRLLSEVTHKFSAVTVLTSCSQVYMVELID